MELATLDPYIRGVLELLDLFTCNKNISCARSCALKTFSTGIRLVTLPTWKHTFALRSRDHLVLHSDLGKHACLQAASPCQCRREESR